MSGKPLSYLIRKSYESYKRNHYNKKLPAVIREVMENVESFVRYQSDINLQKIQVVILIYFDMFSK